MRYFNTSIALMLFAPGAALAQFGQQHTIPAENVVSLAGGDLDNDGDNDLVIGSREGLFVHWNQDGAGALATGMMIANFKNIVAVVDLDQDGLLDLVASNHDSAGVYLYQNIGAGAFAAGQLLTANYVPLQIASGDLNGDELPDLVLATNTGLVVMMLNSGGQGNMMAPVLVATCNDPVHVTLADLDNDPDADILISNTSGSELTWLENINGSASFQPMRTLHPTAHGVAGDADSDGLMDLLFIDGTQQILAWQRGLAQNSFSQANSVAVNLPAGTEISGSDMDGDGDLDLITSCNTLDQISWYENINGQGSFGPMQIVTTSFIDPTATFAMDVNGDGDKELFAASISAPGVSWYENLAQADFSIAGRVFMDVNEDGLFNGADHGLVNVAVEVEPGVYSFTNASGVFHHTASPGNYQVRLYDAYGYNYSTAGQHSVSINAQQTSATGLDLGLVPISPEPQLDAVLNSAAPICANEVPYWVCLTNTGQVTADLDVHLALNSNSDFLSASIAPDALNGNELVWQFAAVPPTHQRLIRINVKIPGPAFSGTVLNDQLTVNMLEHGRLTHTVDYLLEQTVLCAYDPNDKSVTPQGNGDDHEVHVDEMLHYTIRFQNTGTAPAENVWIDDTLSSLLDLSTFQFQSASHPVSVRLQDNGELRFFFENIQLPDSGADMTGSQGYARYSVMPRADLEVGTRIENTAHIFFDLNDPITTNTVFNTTSENGLVYIGSAFQDEGNDLLVTPNPTGGDATIDLSQMGGSPVQLTVTDAAGRLVGNQNVKGGGDVVLRRGNLKSGTYTIRAISFGSPEKPRKARVIFN